MNEATLILRTSDGSIEVHAYEGGMALSFTDGYDSLTTEAMLELEGLKALLEEFLAQ